MGEKVTSRKFPSLWCERVAQLVGSNTYSQLLEVSRNNLPKGSHTKVGAGAKLAKSIKTLWNDTNTNPHKLKTCKRCLGRAETPLLVSPVRTMWRMEFTWRPNAKIVYAKWCRRLHLRASKLLTCRKTRLHFVSSKTEHHCSGVWGWGGGRGSGKGLT